MAPEPAVAFTEYALMRMHQRDILEDEVRAALAASLSRHRKRKDGRVEVRQKFRRRVLPVVYRRDGADVTVINAMWE